MMLVVTAALSSCNKDKTTDPAANDQTSGTALPLKAVTYVTNNYPDATIDFYVAVTSGSADFLVTLNTTEELAFNKSGDFMGKGEYFHGGNHGDTIHCDSVPGGGHPGGHHGGGIPIDSLPTALKDYVTANYSGFVIRHAEYDSLCSNGVVIEVMLFQPGSEPVKLYFDTMGNFLMRADRIVYIDIPQAVKDYITANYTGYNVCFKSEKFTLASSNLEFVVYLHQGQTRKSVRLDAAGTFICEKIGSGHGGPGGGGGHGGGHHGGIPIDSLPVAITSYITSNYSSYNIRHAKYDSLCVNGLVYEVRIDKAHVPPMDLYFDMAGVFLMQSDRIPYPQLPQAVRDYLMTNYAGYFACEIPQKLTLADGTIQYLVKLRQVHTFKSVRIDANGLLICEL